MSLDDRTRTWQLIMTGRDLRHVTLDTQADMARLLTLLGESEGPLAVMGMGTLGRAARLLFARAGSVLNYGWLDRPLVPGQWSAAEFRELLART